MNEKEQESYDKVIDDLMECYSVATQLLPYCLQMGGEHSTPRHIITMIEAAKLCQITADFMLKESAYSKQLAQVTSDACKTLSVSCQNFKGDENMKTMGMVAEKCGTSTMEFSGLGA